MVVDLLEPVDVGERVVAGRRVAAIEEPGAVLRPGRARELDPAEVVGPVARRRDLADAELLPVAAAARRPVHQELTIVRDGEGRERYRAVRGEEVRVEEHGGWIGERAPRVEHSLVLEPLVLEIEVAAAFAKRRPVLGIIPQPGEALPDALALPDRGQVRLGQAILGLDPAPGVGRVGILEPAIGVGDRGAVVVLDDRGGRRGGTRQPPGRFRPTGGADGGSQWPATSPRATRRTTPRAPVRTSLAS